MTEQSRPSYGAYLGAGDALVELSEIGSKDKKTVRRLAQMIKYVRRVSDDFQLQRDVLTNGHAKRDDSGKVEVKTTEDGKQSIVFKNEPQFLIDVNAILRESVAETAEPPKPFDFDDLTNFEKMPAPFLIARLGPFVSLDS